MRVIASRACFAVGDSRSPVTVAIVSMVVNVVGDLTLGVAYGIPGLAASTSLSLCVGAAMLVVMLARRHGGVSLRPMAAATVRVGAAALAGVILDAETLLPGAGAPASAAQLAATGVAVVGVYVGALLALRSPELHQLVHVVRDRFLRGRRS